MGLVLWPIKLLQNNHKECIKSVPSAKLGTVACSHVHTSHTYTLPFCIKGICAFPCTEDRVCTEDSLSQGKGSNNASQHRGPSVGKGDLELPFKLFQVRVMKSKMALDTLCSFTG